MPKSSMPNMKAVFNALAEQSFMTHILAKRLVELKVLQPGELSRLFESSSDKAEFIKDFIRHLESLSRD